MQQIEVVVSNQKIDIQDWQNKLLFDASGAQIFFSGTTRNNLKGKSVEYLFYEAYVSMAEKQLHSIAQDCIEQFGLLKIILVHRIGIVRLQETSLLIGVSSAHSKQAIEAIEHALLSIKTIVPIWKKEFFTHEKSEWVANHTTNSTIYK